MENKIKQIQSAVLDMMKRVRFIDEKNQHRYEDLNGNWLQGVSTVSSIIPKDWLSAWGAKEAVKALGYSDFADDLKLASEMLEKIKTCSVEKYVALLKNAKGASARKSKDALVDGKKGHEWLEKYVLAKIRKTELPEMPEDNLKRPLTQFIQWAEKEIKTWVVVEAQVAYPEKGYAGTLDAIGITNQDKLAVVDFKFASHISEDYYLQTAGYQATFEPYKILIDERIIIRLPKTLTLQEWDKTERKYKIVENNIEVLKVPTSYEMDRDVFFSCLPVKKWINLMQNFKN